MVQLNLALREINCKIVYFGPGLSGKTTNLEKVHEKAPEDSKGDLTSIATESDRTLFFDFMPLNLGTVGGMRTKFQLYTVPGQVYYNSTRKLVLRGADGVIFVADSSPDKMDENAESLENLEDCLKGQGKSLSDFPHVIQWNKRDLPGALPVEELNRLLNHYGAPSFEAVASEGDGVVETFKALSGLVLEKVKVMADRHAAGRQDPGRPGSPQRREAGRPGGAPVRATSDGRRGGPTMAPSAPSREATPRPAPAEPETMTPAAVLTRPGESNPDSATDSTSDAHGLPPVRPERTVAGRPVQETGDRAGSLGGRGGSLSSNLSESTSGYQIPMHRSPASSSPISGLIRQTPIGVNPVPSQPVSEETAEPMKPAISSTSGRFMVSSARPRRRSGLPGGAILWIGLAAAAAGGLAFAYIGGML